MAEPLFLKRAPTDPVGRVLYEASRLVALAGGLVLVAMTVMTLVSIAGRALFSTPLPGDYELVQVGCAIAVAAFLPLTQMRGGHVIVDFFTVNAHPALRAGFDALGAALVGLCGGVFAWRLAVGAISLKEANDQTTILGLPTWIPVAAMAPCFALLAAAGIYTAWRHWSARDGGGDGTLALPGSDR